MSHHGYEYEDDDKETIVVEVPRKNRTSAEILKDDKKALQAIVKEYGELENKIQEMKKRQKKLLSMKLKLKSKVRKKLNTRKYKLPEYKK